MKYELIFKPYGERAILLEWPAIISDEIMDDIARMREALSCLLKRSDDIVDVVSAYNSLTIIHRHPVRNFTRRKQILEKIYHESCELQVDQYYCYQLPVCYHPQLAADLEAFLEAKNLSLTELISLHTGRSYRFCFFGFLPGFMYLSGLDPRLYHHRKDNPSRNIGKGAVAIGGQQTGIYPGDSPGGWHVIGMSPIEFSGNKAGSLANIRSGDRVQFVAITEKEYQHINSAVLAGRYQIPQVLVTQGKESA